MFFWFIFFGSSFLFAISPEKIWVAERQPMGLEHPQYSKDSEISKSPSSVQLNRPTSGPVRRDSTKKHLQEVAMLVGLTSCLAARVIRRQKSRQRKIARSLTGQTRTPERHASAADKRLDDLPSAAS